MQCLIYRIYGYVSICLTGDPPTIATQPTSHLTTVNIRVTLICEGTGTGPITYCWETINVNGGEWMNISNSNCTKLIRNLEQSHQFRCVVSNQFGTTLSNVATINVLSKCTAIAAICKYQVTAYLNRNCHSSSR